MIFNSIRWRLQVWHGLILVAVLAGFGFTAYHAARENQLRRIDQEELTPRLMAPLFRPGPPGPPPGPPSERRPEGPRGEGPGEGRRRFDPEEFRKRLRQAIEKAGALDSSQTNRFYYVLWQGDGALLAQSSGSPQGVPMPQATVHPPALRYGAAGSPQSTVQGPESAVTAPVGRQGSPGDEAAGGPRRNERGQDARATFGPPGDEAGGGGPMRPRPGPPMPPIGRTRGEYREIFRAMPGGEVLLVGRSIAEDLKDMQRLALRLVVAGAGVLLLGLAGGWWLATRAIRPIEDIGATALKIAAGDLSQRINVADTDSELGRLAGVLNSTFSRLEAAFAHQARFTSDASHELRTPVSVVLTQTQSALARERTMPEYREALEACQRAAQRMRKLTQSLLALARLDAGQDPMRREPLDLARVTRECVEMVRPLAAESGLELRCDLPTVMCPGDAERLSQVATNLLSNAIRFNRPGGEVRISTRAENEVAVLTVADTGQGIPDSDLPHIFERFYRVDESRSGVQGGTGLGLAISKAIVDAHSGTLEVSSQPGAGSTFTVKLPLR
ncbi:MAG TPA: HAMP domain-containing sensor histidine kinase [Dongiaceae bacterium]|nr:HAMP domain-containing sensor histidine kinase [Dongiaceae bacterium]